MDLRPYQSAAVSELRLRWRDKPILVCATGSGKSVILAAIAEGAVARGRRVLALAHTRNIVQQLAERFKAHGFDVGVIMAEQHEPDRQVLVGSIQTVSRRVIPRVDVLLIDEVHTVGFSARELIDTYTSAGAAVIGCTATPQRLDGRGLGELGFGCLIEPITTAELIKQGFLANPIVYARPFSAAGLSKQHGEFTAASSEEAMRTLHGEIASHWAKHGVDRRGIAFCCTVRHAEIVAEKLHDAGANAFAISGSATQRARDAAIAAIQPGSVLCVCSLFGIGFDLPALDLAILARPTASLTVYRQQVGRIMRVAREKPQPIVLDHAGNTVRHGFVTDRVEWSLDGRAKRDDRGPAPFKVCPECFLCVATATKVCECGYVFVARVEVAETQDELMRIDAPVGRDAMYVHFLQRAWSQGYRVGWARMKFKTQFGSWPRLSELERLHYPCTDHAYETKTNEHGYRRTACQWCARVPDPAADPVRDRLAT